MYIEKPIRDGWKNVKVREIIIIGVIRAKKVVYGFAAVVLLKTSFAAGNEKTALYSLFWTRVQTSILNLKPNINDC